MPLFQHLHHNGVELEDNARTLGDLGILTDDHIYVFADEIPDDESVEAIDDEGENALVAKACAASLAGFTGTVLFGLPGNAAQIGSARGEDDAAELKMDEPMPEVGEGDPVQCK